MSNPHTIYKMDDKQFTAVIQLLTEIKNRLPSLVEFPAPGQFECAPMQTEDVRESFFMPPIPDAEAAQAEPEQDLDKQLEPAKPKKKITVEAAE